MSKRRVGYGAKRRAHAECFSVFNIQFMGFAALSPSYPRRRGLPRIPLALNPGYNRSMTISPTGVRFDEHTMWIDLSDARTIGVPLAWFPRLLHATPAQRGGVELSRIGLHWEEVDEDISAAGLLAGRGDVAWQATEV